MHAHVHTFVRACCFPPQESSHFEVIELLRVANRPLTLRLRRVGRERLLRRRAEMRALTRPQGVVGNNIVGGGGGVISTQQAVAVAVAAAAAASRCPPPRSLPPPPRPPPPVPPAAPPRKLLRQDSFPLGDPRRGDGGARAGSAVSSADHDNKRDADTYSDSDTDDSGGLGAVGENGDGVAGSALSDAPSASAAGEARERVAGVRGSKEALSMTPVGTTTAGAAAEAAVIARSSAVGGGGTGQGVGGGTREQTASAAAAAGLAGNWEAVEWAESCLLTVSAAPWFFFF